MILANHNLWNIGVAYRCFYIRISSLYIYKIDIYTADQIFTQSTHQGIMKVIDTCPNLVPNVVPTTGWGANVGDKVILRITPFVTTKTTTTTTTTNNNKCRAYMYIVRMMTRMAKIATAIPIRITT